MHGRQLHLCRIHRATRLRLCLLGSSRSRRGLCARCCPGWLEHCRLVRLQHQQGGQRRGRAALGGALKVLPEHHKGQNQRASVEKVRGLVLAARRDGDGQLHDGVKIGRERADGDEEVHSHGAAAAQAQPGVVHEGPSNYELQGRRQHPREEHAQHQAGNHMRVQRGDGSWDDLAQNQREEGDGNGRNQGEDEVKPPVRDLLGRALRVGLVAAG
mmetsp:Transcript_19232/g.73572  ORF Transcript_19232/g.73572 Transcript_19232/m.73572 type:complete len:214 (-) Transcript_19232:878-1519(-)